MEAHQVATDQICVTCGTQYPGWDGTRRCPICEDERQYVGLAGQQWTSLAALQATHRNVLFKEGEGIWGIHTQPQFGIGQRALFLRRPEGGFLWDCVSLIDPSTVTLIEELGGITGIAISHPHYYTTMVEWSRTFRDAPIYLHEADRQWVQRPDPSITYWSGETYKIAEDLTLVRLGTHFAGHQALHWSRAEGGLGALMSGDMPQVCMDRRYVSFMYSYPNLIPVNAVTVRNVVKKLRAYPFSKLYGAWPGFCVEGDAKAAIERSAERYLRAIGDSGPLDA